MMELEESKGLKRELYKEIDQLKKEHVTFKLRISVFANLFLPGIGFFVFGKSYLKGLVSLILFISYNYLFFTKIFTNTDFAVAVLYYIPAISIWAVSTIMVSSLDD